MLNSCASRSPKPRALPLQSWRRMAKRPQRERPLATGSPACKKCWRRTTVSSISLPISGAVPVSSLHSRPMIRALLVDDHEVFLSGLRAVLGEVPGLHVAGTATTVAEGKHLCKVLSPDLVVLDIRLP